MEVFTNVNARRFSVRTKSPGSFFQLKLEAFFGRSQDSWRYFPVLMRGVFRSEAKRLAVFSSLNARCVSVRTKFPGGIFQFEFEVFVGQDQNSWRFLLVQMGGVCRSGPKFLAIFPSLNTRCLSVRTKIPGGIFQYECDVRTEIPGEISQFKCEAFFAQNRNSWRYLPVGIRGVCRSGQKRLAIVTSLNARCCSVRAEVPGSSPQFRCEVFVSQNQISWQRLPV